MSIYETSITNPKKQLEFYKDLSEQLQQKNQELKKQLEEHNLALENLAYWKGKNESKMKINRLRKENQELKKQLEKKYEKVGTLTGELLYEENTKLINQQKEFIRWLEQNIENEEYCYLSQNPSERCRKDVFEEVLSKYKEIVGEHE